jgi:hypothetical protein
MIVAEQFLFLPIIRRFNLTEKIAKEIAENAKKFADK